MFGQVHLAGVELRVVQPVQLQRVKGRRAGEAALDDHAVALAVVAVTDGAVDVVALLASGDHVGQDAARRSGSFRGSRGARACPRSAAMEYPVPAPGVAETSEPAVGMPTVTPPTPLPGLAGAVRGARRAGGWCPPPAAGPKFRPRRTCWPCRACASAGSTCPRRRACRSPTSRGRRQRHAQQGQQRGGSKSGMIGIAASALSHGCGSVSRLFFVLSVARTLRCPSAGRPGPLPCSPLPVRAARRGPPWG